MESSPSEKGLGVLVDQGLTLVLGHDPAMALTAQKASCSDSQTESRLGSDIRKKSLL